MKRLWHMKVTVMSIVFGGLASALKNLGKTEGIGDQRNN